MTTRNVELPSVLRNATEAEHGIHFLGLRQAWLLFRNKEITNE